MYRRASAPKLVISLVVATVVACYTGPSDESTSERTHIIHVDGFVQVDHEDVLVEVIMEVPTEEDDIDTFAARTFADFMPNAEYIGWDHDQDFRFSKIGHKFSTGQAKYFYNASNQPTNGTGVNEAAATWSNAGANFVFLDGGATTRCPSLAAECGTQRHDGNNDVGWKAIATANVLGVTYTSTRPEFDMLMDADRSWGGTSVDARTVFVHELGHGLGLGHSNVNGSCMFASYGGVRRSLHSDDVAGIKSIYGEKSSTPPPSAQCTRARRARVANADAEIPACIPP